MRYDDGLFLGSVANIPFQFTQLGSPRKQVIDNAIRDLEYHAELLSLLKMPPQQDRDAVMILHLGGVFGDKAATLDRFRENYKKLPQGIKDRLVLENDDVSWSVHDLLPLCEELNIPTVLDFHHNNIIFDAEQIREGTKDIVDLFPRILATWKRKNITPKMHYSEPTPAAITGRQRRKHSPRVSTLPPCPPEMDLMIEAKDKEQAVFELMRTFKLPGFDTFNDMIPHVRKDDNKPVKIPKKKPAKKRKTPKKKRAADDDDDDELEAAEEPIEAETEDIVQAVIPEEEVGMGGPEGRVYWPPGMEEWLRPVKKVVKKKEPEESKTPVKTPVKTPTKRAP
jgi:UV DNA damage endonuclease